jgi:transcription elongation factor
MTNEVTIGQGNLQGYELYDLVALNENELAVVIMVGSERLKVINQLENIKEVSPQEMQGKRNYLSG